ncbi:MAG: MBL fold metallo-hydrolase [Longimicrobiales bacterium]
MEAHLEDFDVRGVLVCGDRQAVVWDTLARPADMAGVADVMGGLPFTVVYSHGDWDHVLGTCGLGRAWEAVVAHSACGPRFREEIPLTLAERRISSPGAYDRATPVPPTRTFRNRLTLDLGGVTLELHSLPGHTPDTIIGYLPEWGALLGGDAVEAPLPFLNPGSPVKAWAEKLETWAEALDDWNPSRHERALAPEQGRAGPEGRTPPDLLASSPPVLPLVIPSHGPLAGTGLLRANARYLRDLAAGKEPELPGELTAFYRETHAANRVLALG